MYNWIPKEVSASEEDLETQSARDQYRLGYGEYFLRSTGLAFDRYNTVGQLIEENDIIKAEEEAGTYENVQDLLPSDDAVTFDVDALHTNPNAISKEEFEKHNYGKRQVIHNADGTVTYGPERVPWNYQMTEQRAKLLGQKVDERDYDQQILDRSNTNALYSALGFGAGLVASFADPINLIPVFGQAKIGATMGARVLAGARGGLIGTALADSILLPMASQKGEEVGFDTLALDLTFGGMIGGAIGGAGGLFHNRRVRGMAGEESALKDSLIKSGFDEGDAATKAHDVINCLADTKHRSEMSAAVRKMVGGQDRVNIGRILDRAISALVSDGDMDVASWSKLLGIEEPGRVSAEAVKPRLLAEMLEAVEKEGVPQVSFGRLSPDRLSALSSIARVGDMDIVRDGNLTLPSNLVWKLFNKDKGLIQNHASADQIADVLMEAINFDRDASVPQGSRTRAKKIRKLQDQLLESGFIERDEQTGAFRINAETSLGSERKRLVSEMEMAGIDHDKAESYAKLHVAQALAFQKAYGVDAVKALRNRSISKNETPNDFFQGKESSKTPDQALGDEARAKREADSKSWSDSVESFVNRTLPRKGLIQVLSQTPLIFLRVGARQLPIKTKSSVLNKVIFGKHGIDKDLVKQVASKLDDPVMIIKSTGNDSLSDITVMIDLKDSNGSSFVVPVIFSQKNGTYELNFTPSIYLKNDEITKKPSNQWFADQLSLGNVLYANKQKVREWNRVAKRQLPGWNSIPNKGTILFEDTLVNDRLANPSFYQPHDGHGAASSGMNTFMQDAYNGSPNKFDVFSTEHIGEGEGGAAHGWGLYFAFNKGTSVEYASRLSKRGKGHLYRVDIPEDNVMLREEDPFRKQPEIVQAAIRKIIKGISKEKAEEIKKEAAAQVRAIYPGRSISMLSNQTIPQLKSQIAQIRNLAKGEEAFKGKMSFGGKTVWENVNLILKKYYSDEDIEILKDPNVASEEIERLEVELKKYEDAVRKDEIDRETKRIEQKNKILNSTILNLFKSGTGEDIYKYITIALGSPKKASLALNAEGVEGIRYKGSTDGECAVVFNDKAIKETTRLYQSDGSNAARGMVDFSNAEPGSAGETYRIFLSPDADASTIPHESAHIFLRELENAIGKMEKEGGNAEQAMADLRELRKYAGVAEEGKLDADSYRTLQEAVARGFEQYLAEGVAPNPALADVFSRMKQWLKSIYADIKAYVAGTDGVELKSEVREVFDRWLDADRVDATPDVHDASVPAQDFSRPRPRPTITPDTVEKTDKAIDDMLDNVAGSPLDHEAARIAKEGDILPEHAAMLQEADDEIARADVIENAALETLECIIGSI